MSSNVTTETLELTFTFAENTIIKKGKFTRKVTLDGPTPTGLDGDQVEWLGEQEEGFFSEIFTDSKELEKISLAFSHMSLLINEVIPFSLEYYLGMDGGDEEEDDLSEIDGEPELE